MVMLKSSAFLNSFFMSSQSASQGKTLFSGLKSGGSTTAPGDNLFARLLAKTKPGAVFAVNSHAKPFFSTEVDTSVAVVRPKGKDNNSPIANILESAFLKHGVSPDNVVLSREDFDFLATVLEDMGFSRSSLKSFFQEINETRSDGLVTLSHFLKDLSGFEQTEALESNISISLTNSLDKSAVPHLELILRDLDMPSEKIDSLLSSVARKTGAIDIEKLVFQLKAYVDTKDKNSDASQVADKLPIAKDTKDAKRVQSDPPSVQRVTSGLEKLGLSVPNKASHLPFTLETLIQSLEKKIGETVSVPKNMPVDATRIAESVLEMPAVKSMAMEKTEAYFGFAREMMVDKLNKPDEKSPAVIQKTGEIDIEQLLFQLKSIVNAKGDKPGSARVAFDPVQPMSGHQEQLFDPQAIQRVMSGLEKLGLSMPNKTSQLPFTLEGIVQFLEKKVQESASVPQNSSMNAYRMAESVQEMPAGKGVTGQKIESDQVKSYQSSTSGEMAQNRHSSFSDAASGLFTPDRHRGVFDQPPLSVERMDFLLSASTRETGDIDIEQLLFQLKSIVNAKGDKPGSARVALDPVQPMPGHQAQLFDPQAIQRVISGLEKLGLSVPNKASHLPFTLETVVQFLEKKVQESASVSKNTFMNAYRMAESMPEMPAGKGLTAKKDDSSNVFSEKKGTNFKSDMESRLMSADVPKQNMEKGGIFNQINTDSSPMQRDVSKSDGAGRQEIHQNLMAGGEKLQGAGISFTNVAESVSVPVKQSVVSQQSPLPSAVVNQVGKEIASFLHRGDRIFTLQLKPPELGMVNIEMDVKENVLKMSVVTETSSAKDMLHANYVDLKRVLEGYGIRVETFDVQLSSNLNHTSANGDGLLNQQHSQGGMGKNIRLGKSVADAAEDDTVEQSILPQKNNEARLNLLA
jgi:hypothetical protein